MPRIMFDQAKTPFRTENAPATAETSAPAPTHITRTKQNGGIDTLWTYAVVFSALGTVAFFLDFMKIGTIMNFSMSPLDVIVNMGSEKIDMNPVLLFPVIPCLCYACSLAYLLMKKGDSFADAKTFPAIATVSVLTSIASVMFVLTSFSGGIVEGILPGIGSIILLASSVGTTVVVAKRFIGKVSKKRTSAVPYLR